MTVYSKLSIVEATKVSNSPIWKNNSILNLFLAVFLTIVFLIYIFLSNHVVSEKYSQNLLRRELNKINVSLNLENSTAESQVSIEALYSFAQKYGMIEAKDTESIYASVNKDAGFALNNPGN